MRKIKTLCASLIMSCMFSNLAFAAEIESLNIKGYETLSEDAKTCMKEDLKEIPSYICDYHNYLGATVSIKDNIEQNGTINNLILGLYELNNSNITIKKNMESPYFYGSTLVHELGHFVYFKSIGKWSEPSKQQLKTEYEFWKQYSPACTSEEETFSHLYQMYYTQDKNMISKETEAMILEAESICKEIYEAMVKNNTTEYGPGIGI